MLIVQDVDLTPNPQALKFVMSERLLQKETRNFPNQESAENDPLAKGILKLKVLFLFFIWIDLSRLKRSRK